MFTADNDIRIEEEILFQEIQMKYNRLLTSMVLDQEIMEAVKQFHHLNSLVDGIQSIFHKKCWRIAGNPIGAMVRSFFHSGHRLKEINRSYIALVPKVEAPERVSHYTPNSICNVTYKIISKIMTNRLKMVLNKIISALKSAFVQRRCIYNNILIIHEISHSFQNKIRRPSFML